MISGLIIVYKKWHLFNKNRKIILRDFTMIENAVHPVLILPAKVEEDNWGNSYSNIEIINYIHQTSILMRMLVVTRQIAVVISTTLLRILFAEVPVIAGPHIVTITDKETHNEVVNAHLDESKIKGCAWVQQEDPLPRFYGIRSSAIT